MKKNKTKAGLKQNKPGFYLVIKILKMLVQLSSRLKFHLVLHFSVAF